MILISINCLSKFTIDNSSNNQSQIPKTVYSAGEEGDPIELFSAETDKEEARKVLPENSTLWQSLDGEWRFHWAKNPEERAKDFFKVDFDASAWAKVQVPMNWNVVGVQKDGTFKYGEPLYSNQRVIFQHSVAVGDWKGGVMRTPPKNWMTYKNRNEVGSYRRTFTVPADCEVPVHSAKDHTAHFYKPIIKGVTRYSFTLKKLEGGVEKSQ